MNNSLNHDETSLVAKVPELKVRLLDRDFRPDMIIGIARGGLVIAAHLSKEFGTERLIPVISLWPQGREFDNALNRVNVKRYFKSEAKTGKTLRILIVDDVCRSGHTLARAKTYVEKSIGMPNFKIETAAISFYEHLYSQHIAPTYFVARPKKEISDALGEVAKRGGCRLPVEIRCSMEAASLFSLAACRWFAPTKRARPTARLAADDFPEALRCIKSAAEA